MARPSQPAIDLTNRDHLRAVAVRAYAVMRKADCPPATSSPGRVRGWKNWTRGCTVSFNFGGAGRRPHPHFYLCPMYDMARERAHDLALAVAALRAAGWTVADDGVIEALPPVENK